MIFKHTLISIFVVHTSRGGVDMAHPREFEPLASAFGG